MNESTRQYLIRGRVQGVGYRAFARASASDVRGWARNLADGRVEVWAQGEPEALDAFAEALARGPAGGRVDAVERRDVAGPTERFSTFETRKDGVEPCTAASSP